MILTDPKHLTPTFYKMFYRRVKCQHCGTTHSYDQIVAMVQVAGGYNGVPVKSMGDVEYNLPIKVETVDLETTPWCHLCFHPDLLKHLPKADPTKQRPQAPSWAGTGLSKPKPQPKPKPAKDSSKPKTYTIDDLDI